MTKIYNNQDFQQNQALNLVLHQLAGAPSSPKNGQIYWNTASLTAFIWNGTAWRPTDAAGLTDGSIPNAALTTNPLSRANHTGTQLAATVSDLAATVKAYSLDMFASPAANLNINNKLLNNVATGVAGTDATNLAQVNAAITAAIQGITSIKTPVRVVATTNVALTGLQTIDGVTLIAGDRVLLVGQTTATQNNIYVAASGAWSVALDAATGDIAEGTQVLVEEGSTRSGAVYRITTATAITVGTTSIAWVQTNTVTSYTADGVTLTLTGFQFAAKLDGAGWLTSSGSGIAVDKTKVTGKFAGTITGDATTTSFVFAHNLNNTAPLVNIRDSSGAQVLVDNTATTANSVTVTFATAPGAGINFVVGIQG